MRNGFLFLAVLSLIGCSSPIELEQADYEPKIVVDGWIEQGREACVYLTMWKFSIHKHTVCCNSY